MKHCPHCHVDVKNPRATCPLCHNPLQGGDGTESWDFPYIPLASKKYAFLIRILLFATIAGLVICFAVNYFHRSGGLWSLIVLAASAFFWVSVAGVLNSQNSLMSLSRGVLVLCLLLFVIDILYGFHRWSINYAIPAVFLSTIAAVIAIAMLRRLRFSDFVIYIVITGLLLLIPLLFLLTGLATVSWPSLVCIIAGLLSLVGIFIFADSEIRDELRRRFHL